MASEDDAEESMPFRKLTFVPLLTVAFGLASCSGGTGTSGTPFGSCSDGTAFCLVSCNLGCTSDGGCSVTDIAENQPIELVFNQEIDPRSVDSSTISLRTSAGLEPVGDFVVQGSRVSFIPEVRAVQGATFYGFASNETYVLSIVGGAGAPVALVSTAGDRLPADFTCQLSVTRGVIDLDQRPPVATVVTPTVTHDVSRDTNIVMEFSELIDFGPFFGVTGEDAPVVFRIKRTRMVDGRLECFSAAETVAVLAGAPRLQNDTLRGKTVLTFQPGSTLPSEHCLEVEVSSRVRDLAGTRSLGQIFNYVIETGVTTEYIEEFDFQNDLELDLERSSGSWSNGAGVFGAVGGDGRHGDFDIRDGERETDTHFIWSTDDQRLPPKPNGFLNEEVTVTDGRFQFSSFVVPPGFILEIRGSNLARILVRGEVRIDGEVRVSGADVNGNHNGRNSIVLGGVVTPGRGQAGGVGGPGGGAGGNGAWACDGDPVQPPHPAGFNGFNGYHGEDLTVPAGHAYSGQEADTGGRGATLFPAHGDQSLLIFRGFGSPGTYGVEACAGAGGAGFVVAGETGTVPNAGAIQGSLPYPNTNAAEAGPPSSGGVLFPLLTFPASFESSDYFLVGGSGGGGGASSPLFSLRTGTADQVKYRSGGGGGGGGGGVLLRSGSDFGIGSSATIDASGGSCAPTATAFSISQRGVPGPGGAGSGGTVVLQAGGAIQQDGTLDVRGGTGSKVELLGFFACRLLGGDSSDGFIRFERAGTAPTLADLGTTFPAGTQANLGLLTETDDRAGFQSLWRTTGETFPPIFVRYEVDAEVDGGPLETFSDDPSVGTAAIEGSAPILFYIQGAQLEPGTGQPRPGTQLGGWRRYVGDYGGTERSLNSDGPTDIRWILLQDLTMAQSVIVRSVRVYYRV